MRDFIVDRRIVFLITALGLSACSSSEPGPSNSSSSGGTGVDAGANSAADTGNSEEGEAVFASEDSPSPDKILGVWASPPTKKELLTIEIRTRFSKDAIVIAGRCTRSDTKDSVVAGVTASARISSSELAVLEVNADERRLGDLECKVSTSTRTTKACSEEGLESSCFRLDGTSLTIFGESPLEKVVMTKVSD